MNALPKLGTTLVLPIAIVDGNGVAADPAAPPTFRVYGPAGKMNNGTGTLSQLDTGAITNATNANPVVVTSNGHGLQTGTEVTITGVGGNTNANGTWVLTDIDANTFSIPVAGNAAYTSGGAWHVTGLYQMSLSVNGGDGYVQGTVYTVYVTYTIGGTTYTRELEVLVI